VKVVRLEGSCRPSGVVHHSDTLVRTTPSPLTARHADDLQAAATDLQSSLQVIGLQLRPEKCKLLAKEAPLGTVSLVGRDVPTVTVATCLGTPIGPDADVVEQAAAAVPR